MGTFQAQPPPQSDPPISHLDMRGILLLVVVSVCLKGSLNSPASKWGRSKLAFSPSMVRQDGPLNTEALNMLHADAVRYGQGAQGNAWFESIDADTLDSLITEMNSMNRWFAKIVKYWDDFTSGGDGSKVLADNGPGIKEKAPAAEGDAAAEGAAAGADGAEGDSAAGSGDTEEDVVAAAEGDGASGEGAAEDPAAAEGDGASGDGEEGAAAEGEGSGGDGADDPAAAEGDETSGAGEDGAAEGDEETPAADAARRMRLRKMRMMRRRML